MSALFPRRRPGAHLPPEAYWGTPAAPLSSAAGLFEPVTPVQPPTEVGAPTQITPDPGPPTIVFPVEMLEQLRPDQLIVNAPAPPEVSRLGNSKGSSRPRRCASVAPSPACHS